jgi:hypothetical protein
MLRLFENRVLRKMFRAKRDEVTRKWRILHNEELCDLYFAPDIIRMIKSRRMRWVGHVANMADRI